MGSLENYKLVYISEVHSISIERFKNSNTYTVYDLVFEQEIDSFTNYFDKFNTACKKWFKEQIKDNKSFLMMFSPTPLNPFGLSMN